MNDVIIEPVRSSLIEGFDHIKNNALELGLLVAVYQVQDLQYLPYVKMKM